MALFFMQSLEVFQNILCSTFYSTRIFLHFLQNIDLTYFCRCLTAQLIFLPPLHAMQISFTAYMDKISNLLIQSLELTSLLHHFLVSYVSLYFGVLVLCLPLYSVVYCSLTIHNSITHVQLHLNFYLSLMRWLLIHNDAVKSSVFRLWCINCKNLASLQIM